MKLHAIPMLCCILMTLHCPLYAQSPIFEQAYGIDVQAYGSSLALAWSGGFNSPQFSQVDLNNDGTPDLFVFDRTSKTPMALINNGTPNVAADYSLEPEATASFPRGLEDWVLMLDYDCDGVADIFTSHDNGIRVFKGALGAGGYLGFQLQVSKLDYGGNNHLAVSNVDLPAITDIDNDGDVDVLTFNISGGVVEWFSNQSVEMGYGCDSLIFHLETECWGQFYETSDNELLLDNCTGSGVADTGNPPGQHGLRMAQRHPGSTLLATDLDGDSDKDIVLGDVSYDNLIMAVNGGTPDAAHMVSQDVSFPSYDLPAVLPTYPAAYSVDVNNDGLLDMLVSPSSVNQAANHFQCVWYYQNNGNAANFFEFKSDTLLVNQTIDVARSAKPAFFDHNGDGLLDLVVGNFGYLENGEHQSTLALFENIGTPTQPAFRLVTRNYMDVRAQLFTDLPELHPAFGDMDNDGDMDMILGDEDGWLHYFVNNPDGDGVANFSLQQERYKGIDVGKTAAPQIADIDRDGLPDLVVGERLGWLNFFHNIGTPANPDFEFVQNTIPCGPTNGCWGGVYVYQLWDGGQNGYATPWLLENTAGEWELLVGSVGGKVFHYTNIEANAVEGVFTLESDGLIDTLGLRHSCPAVADVDGDGLLEMVVGTYRGGLQWYEQTGSTGLEPGSFPYSPKLRVFPNPASSSLHFELQDFGAAAGHRYRLLDLSGRTLLAGTATSGKPQQLDIGGLPAGLYLLEVRNGQGFACEKVVVK